MANTWWVLEILLDPENYRRSIGHPCRYHELEADIGTAWLMLPTKILSKKIWVIRVIEYYTDGLIYVDIGVPTSYRTRTSFIRCLIILVPTKFFLVQWNMVKSYEGISSLIIPCLGWDLNRSSPVYYESFLTLSNKKRQMIRWYWNKRHKMCHRV